MPLRFDGTVHLGHVLSTGAMLVAVTLAWGDVRQNDAVTDQRLSVLERTIERMADQSTRISVLERVVNDLPDKLDEMTNTLRRVEGNLQ